MPFEAEAVRIYPIGQFGLALKVEIIGCSLYPVTTTQRPSTTSRTEYSTISTATTFIIPTKTESSTTYYSTTEGGKTVTTSSSSTVTLTTVEGTTTTGAQITTISPFVVCTNNFEF